MKKGLTTLGLGVGLMYFLDPDRGPRRRALVRDQYVSLVADLEDWFTGMVRDVGNRIRGIEAELSAMITPDNPTDEQLEARIRSNLGRLTTHAHPIRALVRNGVVTLTGPVLVAEADGIVSGISRVRRVRKVIDELEKHEQADIPSLQGPGRSVETRELTVPRRVITGAAGGILALYGLRRGGLVGAGLTILGVNLLARGVANQSVGQFLSGGHHGNGGGSGLKDRKPRALEPSGGI